jgi:tetratricopeptide (TPR) repeat protein
MIRTLKKTHFVSALSILTLGAAAYADSLVTTTGATLTGSISRTAGGYSVKTAGGPVEVRLGDVKRILHDSSAGAGGSHLHKADPAEVNSLIQMGKSALASHSFADARDAFTDALSLDRDNPTAARGLGFAYLKLERPQKAADALSKAAPNPPVDRTLTLAMAAALISKNNPMRAVKFVTEYLKNHDGATDEPMVNALGIALNRQVTKGDTVSLKSTLFTDAVKLYTKLNDKLEAANPGKKRWGITWDSVDAVNKKMKAYNEAMKKKSDAWNSLQSANARLTAANNALQNAGYTNSTNKPQVIANAQNEVGKAQSAQADAQSNYDKVVASIADVPGPEYPDTLSMADVDLSMSSPEAIALASPPLTSPPAHEPVVPKSLVTTPPPPPMQSHGGPTPAPTPGVPPPPPPTPEPAAPAAPAPVTRYAVGFAVAPDMLVTAASACEGSSDIEIQTIDGSFFKAEIVRSDHGLALLQAKGAKLASLPLAPSATLGSLTCYGFPDVALFNPVAKQMTVSGAEQTEAWTVSLSIPPRLPGGPILKSGAVVGVELGDRDSDPGQTSAATLKSLMSLVVDSAHPGQAPADPKQAVVMVMAAR